MFIKMVEPREATGELAELNDAEIQSIGREFKFGLRDLFEQSDYFPERLL